MISYADRQRAAAIAQKPAKEAVNVTVDAELLSEARRLGIPLSGTLETALRERVNEAKGQLWLAENQSAINEYSAYVAAHRAYSDGLRRF